MRGGSGTCVPLPPRILGNALRPTIRADWSGRSPAVRDARSPFGIVGLTLVAPRRAHLRVAGPASTTAR